MDFSRRRLLGFGALALLAACGKRPAPAAPVTPAAELTVTPPTLATPSLSELVYRSSIGDVQVVIMRPRDVAGELPVCLALHGFGADARQFVELGLPPLLTATDRAGLPPFAVVAVDGGEWTAEAQRMLVDELPGWLVAAGLAPTPFAVMGISTGAVAAYTYAQEPGPTVVAMVSPAVFPDWAAASDFGLRDEVRWAETNPLTGTSSVPIAVWCGEDDELADAARALAARTDAESFFAPGAGHTEEYWASVMPDVLRHIGKSIG
ncbi:esterase [Actinokineospora sp. UTMC 2448]|uniref:esterase n=1 Tax=Actinokineospora sp. UTMC 2448 TaxID=2268449 RepID=UPI002164C79D|nr:esterase [Actinokineospora sp. UTMC 2448]UVS81045.1 Alpha/beta hydrolase family protein [Actinokineospora sp. UTMC 2448]